MSSDFILTLNSGSSSIKVALYEAAAEPQIVAAGQVSSLGTNAELKFARVGQSSQSASPVALGGADHQTALEAILSEIKVFVQDRRVAAVGHRIVHGGTAFVAPRVLDDAVCAALQQLVPLAPLHQPHNLAAVALVRRMFPEALQVGCFDTAFHRNHTWVNETFALPRRYYDAGVRRYGFHGLSYDYVAGAIAKTDPDLASGRIVAAHLGNGASLCAIKNGQSIASTMGFSALDGLPMGTRCGQIDPGVLLYLMDHEHLDAAALTDLLYRESGLLGLSGISHDMRTLQASDAPEAAQAIAYFAASIRREVGAMAAVLGGIDALVFCGGIGENDSNVRARVCEGLQWLGIALDDTRNRTHEACISTGPVAVLVVPTNEEIVVARAAAAFLAA